MLASRVSQFSESVIRAMSRVAASYSAINLGQGMPDFEPPKTLVEAASSAIHAGLNQYANSWGEPVLRQRLAEKARRFNNIICDPEREITVCCGATECMIAAMLALVEPGDEVIILQPFYENYLPDTRLCGATPVWVRTAAPDWTFDRTELENAFTDHTKAFILCTPNNPTGHVYTIDELAIIADLCRRHNVYVFADEVYEYITYDGNSHISIATLPGMSERTITISGLSKTFSVTGWRLGYCIAQPDITDAIRRTHDYLTICAPLPLQVGGIAAMELDQSYYDGFRDEYQRRRDLFLPYLTEAGFAVSCPQGAYYVMADISAFRATDDTDFIMNMIREVGVSAVPASCFFDPPAFGRTMVRFMFSKSRETLEVAGERLLGLKSLKR